MGIELRGSTPTNPYGGCFAAQKWYWEAYVALLASLNILTPSELESLRSYENTEVTKFSKERVQNLVTALRKLDSPNFQFTLTQSDGSELTVFHYQLSLLIAFLEASGGFWICVSNTRHLYGEEDPNGVVDPSTKPWFF